jgi:hypothetical protein
MRTLTIERQESLVPRFVTSIMIGLPIVPKEEKVFLIPPLHPERLEMCF